MKRTTANTIKSILNKASVEYTSIQNIGGNSYLIEADSLIAVKFALKKSGLLISAKQDVFQVA